MKQSELRWEYCYITGYTVACDPGNQTITPYPKCYRRSEMKVGMNLCGYLNYLPEIYLKEIGENFIVVKFSGKHHKIMNGETKYTDRKPLSYAYSDATISIHEKER